MSLPSTGPPPNTLTGRGDTARGDKARGDIGVGVMTRFSLTSVSLVTGRANVNLVFHVLDGGLDGITGGGDSIGLELLWKLTGSLS